MEDREVFRASISQECISWVFVDGQDVDRLDYEGVLVELEYEAVLFPTRRRSGEHKLFRR